MYGQLWSLVLYGGQIASLGIGVGATALIAAEYERGDRRALSLSSSLSLMLPAVAGVVMLVLILAASPFLAPLLLDSSDVPAARASLRSRCRSPPSRSRSST